MKQEDGGDAKKSSVLIYISNVSEDVWSFISQMGSIKDQAHEINENAFLADRDLLSFAGVHNLIMILPHAVNPDFLEYYLNLFGNKNLEILVPKEHTGQICLDVLHDEKIMQRLAVVARQAKKVSLTSYSASHQFYDLVHQLRKNGLDIILPESPEEPDSWTVNFYGSKGGIRQLAQQSGAAKPDFKMSSGMVSVGVQDTAKIAAKMYLKQKGIVLKTNKGHSGAGMFLFRPGDLPETYFQCQQEILRRLMKEPYWEKFPIIIEELMDINLSIGGGNPNVEFKIHKSGKVEMLYYCGMRVSKDGVFSGVEVSKDVLSHKVIAKIMDVGFFIGEQFATQGYRGYYDADFVATKNGELYITESNVRRTGGTHVYHTAKALFGKDFLYDTYTLSTNLYNLPGKKKRSFRDVLAALEPILFNKKTKEGVVLGAANLLKSNQIAYIVFGKTKKRALELEVKMHELLG